MAERMEWEEIAIENGEDPDEVAERRRLEDRMIATEEELADALALVRTEAGLVVEYGGGFDHFGDTEPAVGEGIARVREAFNAHVATLEQAKGLSPRIAAVTGR